MCCAAPTCPRLDYAATPSPTSTPTPTPSAAKPYSWLPDGSYLTTVQDQIVDQNNNAVTMHGIAWYGFGNPDLAMVEGLQSNGDSEVHGLSNTVCCTVKQKHGVKSDISIVISLTYP